MTVSSSHPQSDRPLFSGPALGAGSPHYHWWITGALMLGFTTVGLSVTVVNIAFPEIMTSLRVDLDVMQWVQTGYMIMQAVIMPSVGWVGARLGNRRVYLLALAIFVSGSALSGLAWDVSSLIVFRLVQAVGGGLLFPTSQVILFETFPEDRRGLAMGVSSLGFSLGPMMGPVMGGYLIEHASWRAVFFINVPVGILGLILAYLILPAAPRQGSRPLDLPGMLTLAAFLVSLLLAVSQGNVEGWDSQYILTLFGIALIAGVGFVVAELRHDQPFVELRLFRSMPFAMASIVVFLNSISFMAANFIVILFLQIHLDYTPLQTAWMMMPSAVVIGVLSVGAGRLSDLLPGKILIIFGLAAVALCLVQYATITTWTSVGTITLWLTARGFARAFTIAPLSAVSLAALDESEVRMGSGLLSLNRGIASTGSVALAATVFQTRVAERTARLAQDHMLAPTGADKLLDSLTTTFQHLGDLNQAAQMKSLAVLHDLVGAEAALHSYHDTFLLIGTITALGIVPAIWMGRTNTAGG